MWMSDIPAVVYKNGKPQKVVIDFDSTKAVIITDPDATGHIGSHDVDPDARVEPDDPKNILHVEGRNFVITDETKKEIQERLRYEDMVRVRGLYPIS